MTKYKMVKRTIPHIGETEICDEITDKTTQQETITWHHYPEEKPTVKWWLYHITVKSAEVGDPPFVVETRWRGDGWAGFRDDEVIAWTADLKGWQE